MPQDSAALAALVGSRLCHDLISPVGAIQNGLELLTLSGFPSDSPEMELIQDSCASAAARIRFFRVAFGKAGESQGMGLREISGILKDLTKGGRLNIDWRPDGDLPRGDVQLAFLAILCCEAALPQGGDVILNRSAAGWSIAAEGPRLNMISALWDMLEGEPQPGDISPDKVQFAILKLMAQEAGRTLRVHRGQSALRIEIL
ncbi:MAG: histidine phosphotransferase family protein [Pelagimonas sp.]|jgi:histidine phosphotransferase ChpT|nr:histidine phosphotransferase family protein [Pelagimonas sp.]